MHPILISPPFGHYYAHPRATSVLGSFTLHRRRGRLPKVLQFIGDNILHPVPDGYRNRIGLRNPGIGSLGALWGDCVYSFVGLEDYDWEIILEGLAALEIETHRTGQPMPIIEINLGCLNVHEYSIRQATLDAYCSRYSVIAKLPSTDKADRLVEMSAQAGAAYLHLSNTLPSDLGSLSGYPLKKVNLPIVEKFATKYPTIPIIGGGGIYEWQDLLDYRTAGATYFSTSTIWMRPWRGFRLVRRFYHEQEGNSDVSPRALQSAARV